MPQTYRVTLSDGRTLHVTTEGGPPSEADVSRIAHYGVDPNRQKLAALRALVDAGAPQTPVVSGRRLPSLGGRRLPDLPPEGGEILGRAKTIVDLLNESPLWWLGDVSNPLENMDAAGPVAGVKKGIRAYHGSPHDFDRFSLSKIGTGEGAQAYGHGLYFADSEGVARNYRDALSAGGDLPLKADPSIRVPMDYAQSSPVRRAEIKAEFQRMAEASWADDAARERAAKQVRAFEAFDKSPETTTPGRMYEVNIHADPDDFLDWDAPLSQQMQQRLSGVTPKGKVTIPPEGLDMSGGGRVFDNRDRKIANKPYPYILKSGDAAFGLSEADVARMLAEGGTGNQVYTRLTATLGSQDKATETLKQAGIPGIKYLDGASRSAGQGSRNYVVFDDKLVEIVKKYGIAAALGAGLINEAQARQLKEQGYQ